MWVRAQQKPKMTTIKTKKKTEKTQRKDWNTEDVKKKQKQRARARGREPLCHYFNVKKKTQTIQYERKTNVLCASLNASTIKERGSLAVCCRYCYCCFLLFVCFFLYSVCVCARAVSAQALQSISTTVFTWLIVYDCYGWLRDTKFVWTSNSLGRALSQINEERKSDCE